MERTQVNLKLTVEMKQRWQRAARLKGMTLTQLIIHSVEAEIARSESIAAAGPRT